MADKTYYFVLLGLANGVRGEHAIPAGSGVDPPQPDGWYWLEEGMTDGVGPFPSREDARDAALGRLDPDNCIVERV